MALEDKIREAFKNDQEVKSSPDEMYRDYLSKHRQGVKNAYYDILRPILESDDVEEETLLEIERLIEVHDFSKDAEDSVEFSAYRNYFYDKENNHRSGEDFNLAWNHHQKCNPHHWQYWCLINDVDEPQLTPLDIPIQYVIEMLCDWQSAGNHYGNTAYEWYDKQKDKMILSENTRKIVEKYIEHLK